MTVYLLGIRAPGERHVKIGYTGGEVEDRVADLQTGCPHPLVILDALPGSQELEREAHRHFADCRVQGEWFDFGDRDPRQLFREFAAACPLITVLPDETGEDGFDLPPGTRIPPVLRQETGPDPGPDTAEIPQIVPAAGRYRDLKEKTGKTLKVLREIRQNAGEQATRAGKPFAPLALWWDEHAAAREELRTPEHKKAARDAQRALRDALRGLRHDERALDKAREDASSRVIFDSESRAAWKVVRGTKQVVREAKADLRQAKADYPASLTQAAARLHTAHLVPTAAWTLFTDSYLATGAFSLSLSAVAVNCLGVGLGRRYTAAQAILPAAGEVVPDAHEAELLRRLEPASWAPLAEPRGLSDVVPSGAKLTPSGIQVKLTLHNTMDISKLRDRSQQLRAALRLKSSVRMEIREGDTGGHARLTLRTRSAAASSEEALKGWKPGDPWAIDTVTGEGVNIPMTKRILVAGRSGTGKSWAIRPHLAEASSRDDHAVVMLDAKRVELLNWRHRVRGASTDEEMLELVDELVEEYEERLTLVPRGRDVLQISPERPRIIVFVDEGAEVIAYSKRKGFSRILEGLSTLARMARAAEIVVVWATQKPLISGPGPGLDTQIAGQVEVTVSLALESSTDAMTVFGSEAIKDGWEAHKLPAPGVALMKAGPGSEPHHLRTRAMSPQDVIALPDRPIWYRKGCSPQERERAGAEQAIEQAEGIRASLSKTFNTPDCLSGEAVKPDKEPLRREDRDDQIMSVLAREPGLTTYRLWKMVDAGKKAVKESLERMQADGLVEQDMSGCWRLAE